MSMPLYASPEQLMRERSELARKGIGRGRSVVVLSYAGGVLFVAENPSTTLHKVSEIYDRIGFAAAGRYSEYEALRRGGIKQVDMWGFAYDRRDVSARQLTNVYAQTLAAIFTEQLKPYEVELCIAQVGTEYGGDELYRVTYDGSVVDEPRFLVMGGQTEPISAKLGETYAENMDLAHAVDVAVRGLGAAASGNGGTSATGNGGPSTAKPSGTGLPELDKLEVAVLDRQRSRRTFRRITGAALTGLLPSADTSDAEEKPESEGGGEA
ncbi:proteasome subunit alpha [Sciscionella sediminilitoris]|uniref:proteasome subunit alpha n=1 Tax=Sciscionella sediminilitoris TaxID=1445613 RepID=UPI0004DF3D62|nr:proteasome subunit alpha [Sciscionella sp. SE31]